MNCHRGARRNPRRRLSANRSTRWRRGVNGDHRPAHVRTPSRRRTHDTHSATTALWRPSRSRPRLGRREGQERSAEDWLRRCREWGNDDDRARHCEVRDVRLPRTTGRLSVDGRMNGGVWVRGWDRSEILVRAKIQTWAESDAEARRLATAIRIRTTEGRVAAEESETGRRSGWSVSYDVYVPRRSDLDLVRTMGGSVEGVQAASTSRPSTAASRFGTFRRVRVGPQTGA